MLPINPLNKKYYADEEMLQRLCIELFPIKVRQVHNKNQYAITCKSLEVFQSYQTIIFIKDDNQYFLNADFLMNKYVGSKTTSKHLYIYTQEFLGLKGITNRKDLIQLIKQGTIKLINL